MGNEVKRKCKKCGELVYAAENPMSGTSSIVYFDTKHELLYVPVGTNGNPWNNLFVMESVWGYKYHYC
jgi:hypothetical protein